VEVAGEMRRVRHQWFSDFSSNATSVINMTPKFPNDNLAEEDRLTHAKWIRAMAAFYGCIVLLVLGLIALTQASSLPPNEASGRQVWPNGLQAERGDPGADPSRKAQ
jgi:hypothetical protein